MAPILAEKSEITNKLLNQVASDQAAAQKVSHVFSCFKNLFKKITLYAITT